MKFSAYQWDETNGEKDNQAQRGWLRLRLSTPSALYITSQGYEALAGYGTAFDLQLSESSTWRVEPQVGLRVFVYRPEITTFEPSGECFTNIDRMSHESGTVLEVRKALRELELQRRTVLRDIQRARSDLNAAASPKSAPASTPPASKDAPVSPPPEAEKGKGASDEGGPDA